MRMNTEVTWLGLDSLERDLVNIIPDAIFNSFLLGLTIALLVGSLLFFIIYLWFVQSFDYRFTRRFILFEHIIPKILFLFIISSMRGLNDYLILVIGISVVLVPSVVSQTMIQLQSVLSLPLVEYYQTKLNRKAIFFYEILPLIRPFLIVAFFSTIINAMLMESVLTYLGIGFEFGTPSVGFLFSDGLNNFYRNELELYFALTLIVTFAILGAWISVAYRKKTLK